MNDMSRAGRNRHRFARQNDFAALRDRSTGRRRAFDKSHGGLTTTDRGSLFADPIFILGLPRSFSWAVCAMIGQHPELFALPELQLFGAASLSEWWGNSSRESFPMAHGLLRAVAQLMFGGQTEEAVASASGWLTRRSQCTTGFILEELIERAYPRIIVEKSPGVVYSQEHMRRMHSMFPTARFIHLVRHPIGHGQSVLRAIRFLSDYEPLPPNHWLVELASPTWPAVEQSRASAGGAQDPQVAWYVLNNGIREFLSHVPVDRQLLLRGEDLVANPEESLRRIASWAGIRTDWDAIEAMKHPERSPFACYGPASARYGVDLFLSSAPLSLVEGLAEHNLDLPVPWSSVRLELRPDVKDLAHAFGYH
jgi:Sulfotransferase family